MAQGVCAWSGAAIDLPVRDGAKASEVRHPDTGQPTRHHGLDSL